MNYSKEEITSVAIKLGRLVNGGVVGYYVGGKTSEVMRNAIPERLIEVVERHKKVALGASLAQSFIPGAGVAATAATVASLWKMYYDINQVLGISISENAGKSLTSAVVTNLSSAAAQGVATVVSEGAKFIPFVGWIASAGISSAASSLIVYGSAYLYLNALLEMYNARGKFDFDYLESELTDKVRFEEIIEDKTLYTEEQELEDEDLEDEDLEDEDLEDDDFEHCLDDFIKHSDIGILGRIDRLIKHCEDEEEIANLNILAAVVCLDIFLEIYNRRCEDRGLLIKFIDKGECYIIESSVAIQEETVEMQIIQSCIDANRQFWVKNNFSSDFYTKYYVNRIDAKIRNLSCRFFTEKYIEELYRDTMSNILYFCTPNGEESYIPNESYIDEDDDVEDSSGSNSVLTEAEEEYLAEYKEMLSDGEVSERDRRFLNKIMKANGISESRAKEIETMASATLLSEEEQEYLDEYREIISEGEISARDQRFLDKLKKTNGISDLRAKEIEAMA